jgi:hypothetical protein
MERQNLRNRKCGETKNRLGITKTVRTISRTELE